MTEFRMPTDISEKEKIVGGLLTAGQLVYFGIGIGIIVGLGLALSGIMGGAGFIISGILGATFAIMFAFYKPHKIPLMTFIKLKIKRRKEEKKLPNVNPDLDDIELNYFELPKF